MAFWDSQQWNQANNNRLIVDGFDPALLKDGAYRLSLGDHAIVSSRHGEMADPYRKLSDDSPLTLEPGQFAHLITEEGIHLPAGAIGFINVATKTKFRGLINISGFHVDPLYSGKLIFTVFNAGPSVLVMNYRDQIFRLWLSDFSGTGGKIQNGYERIPSEWAERLHGTYPSPFALANRLVALEARVDEMRVQRSQLLIAVLIAGLVLLPFVVNLYASVFAPTFGARLEHFLHSPESGSK